MRLTLLAAAALVAACGSTSNRPRPVRPAADVGRAERALDGTGGATGARADDVAPVAAHARDRGPAVARFAGQPVPVGELLEAWLHRASPDVRQYLDELILERLIVAEARRVGVQLDPALVQSKVSGARAAIAAAIEEAGTGMSLEEFIRRRLGLDPGRYLERVERQATLDLLASRCVRAWLFESERAEVRVVVAASRADADLVEAGLVQGVDFSELARRHSADPSAAEGGRIAPVVRSRAAISRLAFTTRVGEVGGPVEEGGRFLFLVVDARKQPVEGGWAQLGPLVEQDLTTRAIEDHEFVQWKAAMVERYEIDTTPFLELAGEPLD
jgi:hypothetical protein